MILQCLICNSAYLIPELSVEGIKWNWEPGLFQMVLPGVNIRQVHTQAAGYRGASANTLTPSLESSRTTVPVPLHLVQSTHFCSLLPGPVKHICFSFLHNLVTSCLQHIPALGTPGGLCLSPGLVCWPVWYPSLDLWQVCLWVLRPWTLEVHC